MIDEIGAVDHHSILSVIHIVYLASQIWQKRSAVRTITEKRSVQKVTLSLALMEFEHPHHI